MMLYISVYPLVRAFRAEPACYTAAETSMPPQWKLANDIGVIA